MSLKDELRRRCRSLLIEFDEEFDDPKLLRAIFETTEALKPFAGNLPEASTRVARIDLVLNYALKRFSPQHESVLLIFLRALLDRCQPGDARREALVDLIKEIGIGNAAFSNSPSSSSATTVVRIFLSYARADEESVRKIYGRLRDAGFTPWMDVEDIIPGEMWEPSIKRAIESSDFFLACLSSHSVNKRGIIQKEIKLALDRWDEKIESDIYLIPARLEECEMPDELRRFHRVDMFKTDGWPRLLQSIREGMARRIP
jgi:hypothetical protein